MHEPVVGKHKCTKCGKSKEHTAFYTDCRKKSGVSSWCRTCSLAIARKAADEKKKVK